MSKRSDTFKPLEKFEIALSKIGDEMEEIAKKAIYAGAAIIADKMKVNLENVISDDSTGQLVASMGITPISNKDSEWSAKVGFDGYNTEGVAFQLIARVIESGTSVHTKKPFVRTTLNQTKSQVVEEMNKIIEEEIGKLIK